MNRRTAIQIGCLTVALLPGFLLALLLYFGFQAEEERFASPCRAPGGHTESPIYIIR